MERTKRELLVLVAEAYNIKRYNFEDRRLLTDDVKKICLYHGISTWDKNKTEMIDAILDKIGVETGTDKKDYSFSKNGLKALYDYRFEQLD